MIYFAWVFLGAQLQDFNVDTFTYSTEKAEAALKAAEESVAALNPVEEVETVTRCDCCCQ